MQSQQQSRLGHLHLIIGPVGAGKSTFALALSQEHQAPRLNLDEWMVELFAPDRPSQGVLPWYAERCQRCIRQIWRIAQRLVAQGLDVVLEIGLITRADRKAFFARVDAEPMGLTIHVLDAPRDVRRERVRRRNSGKGETFAMVVPPEVFELASDMWEPLAQEESAERDVRWHPFLSRDSSST